MMLDADGRLCYLVCVEARFPALNRNLFGSVLSPRFNTQGRVEQGACLVRR